MHLITAGSSDGSGFQDIATSFVYIGNDRSAPEKNSLCNTQITDSGIYSCVGSGNFVFLQLQSFGSISICHFAAYEFFNVAHYGVSYSTSDPKLNASLLGVEKPLEIKINSGVRDQNTVTLNPNSNVAPYWQVDFGTDRRVEGLIIVMKILASSNTGTDGVLIYVTRGEPPSLQTVCNVNLVSS